tara:strand:- start:126 stop:473 length:348 start_codon:yes stop_codon:yes gene_type:complete
VDLDIKDPFSKIIKALDLKLKSPLDDNIKKYLESSYNFSKCPLGKPELDRYCSLAYEDEDEVLLCGAMLYWGKQIQVEGLRSCFLTMKYDMKVAEVNRRKKGNFKGAKYTKVNRP